MVTRLGSVLLATFAFSTFALPEPAQADQFKFDGVMDANQFWMRETRPAGTNMNLVVSRYGGHPVESIAVSAHVKDQIFTYNEWYPDHRGMYVTAFIDQVFSVNYFGRFASIVLAGSDHVDRYQQH